MRSDWCSHNIDFIVLLYHFMSFDPVTYICSYIIPVQSIPIIFVHINYFCICSYGEPSHQSPWLFSLIWNRLNYHREPKRTTSASCFSWLPWPSGRARPLRPSQGFWYLTDSDIIVAMIFGSCCHIFPYVWISLPVSDGNRNCDSFRINKIEDTFSDGVKIALFVKKTCLMFCLAKKTVIFFWNHNINVGWSCAPCWPLLYLETSVILLLTPASWCSHVWSVRQRRFSVDMASKSPEWMIKIILKIFYSKYNLIACQILTYASGRDHNMWSLLPTIY